MIGDHQWAELQEKLSPVSEAYLRRLLRATHLPLSPLVEGVRQDSFPELERTLLALEAEYSAARRQADSARQRECRRAVITAKQHSRLAMRRPGAPAETKAVKEEMVEWMLVWLQDPSVFPLWVRLRKQARGY